MKNYTFLVSFLFFITGVNAQIINFPDANFKAKLLVASPSNQIAKDIAGNYITIDTNTNGEIEVSEALLVYELDVRYSSIISLEGISDFSNIQKLNCESNQLSTIDLTGLNNLQNLYSGFNNLASLYLTGLSNLQYLELQYNQLTTLDLTPLTNLRELSCIYNLLNTLNLTGLSQLNNVDCTGNQLPILDLNGLNSLTGLNCSKNQLTALDLSGSNNLQNLYTQQNQLTTINLTGLNNLQKLDCGYNQLTILTLTGLNSLNRLDCQNNQLTNLDLAGFNNLQILECSTNPLNILDLTGLINLQNLECRSNQLSNLDFTGLNNLQEIGCDNNQLTALNLTGLNLLQRLTCSSNQLTALNIAGFNDLNYLSFDYNLITTIDFTGTNNITNLYCQGNQITTIDLSGLNQLNLFHTEYSTTLTSINLKNNSLYYNAYFGDCPNLKYICTDDANIDTIQNLITSYGYTNCHVNSYCSFVPGGTYYTIQGNNRFDNNNNGCDVGDNTYDNLKFSISDGTNSGSFFADTSGNYTIPVQAGTHTITPNLENPTYFNVSPATVNVTFPVQASPFTKDFCVTANGVHPDLEVTLLPLNRARPGFDALYKIIYKNKGNQTQSGSVNLSFDDAVLDFVTANPATTTQATNSLSWDFINLAPFETREISFTLNVNSPMETPAVNQDDILNYTAAITSPATDETPNDNTIAFNQTVVNSLDPNDKTCIEGTTITPAMVGEYVHYVINFENTGTNPAQNIVVKDLIDTAKFDINTLIPTKGSHEFVTKISDTNRVEFIFEGINLPFDDANNDGFVAFKIKTNSSLVLGDTFTNSANIYFDYNFPIVTNPATTTVQTLGKSDFEFAKYFTVYPNPTSSTLNLSTKSGVSVNSIGIYNVLGQMVIAIPNAQTVSNIDVSSLKTGNYFIKMTTDKGTSNSKFIKN